MKTLDGIDVSGKRVFIRVDFNVPLDKEKKVADDLRIRSVLPTIEKAVAGGGKVILASHLGRPKGKVVPEFSLEPVAPYLSDLLGRPVSMAPDCVGEDVKKMIADLEPGQVLLLENLRFHPEEEKDEEVFSRQLAELCDIYVNDAFAVSHRAHASVHGVTRFVDQCAAGYQMEKELRYFHEAMEDPKRPVAMIVAGAKVSSKIGLLGQLLEKADHLIIGGAMANTFLKARGKNVGRSLVEDDYVNEASRLMDAAARKGVNVHLPVDAVAAPGLEKPEPVRKVSVDEVPDDLQLLDVGPRTIEAFQKVLGECATIVWNGPVGAFETKPFHEGTFALARFLGDSRALTVIGGGDSASAVRQAGMAGKVSYVSTGGGAFLEMMEGKVLPGVQALKDCMEKT